MDRTPSNPLAFVLMDFGEGFQVVYDRVIQPAVEAAGYSVRTANSFDHHESIIRTIVEGIQSAELVIAEITGGNANVMYELGLAHGLAKPTIMLSQDSGAALPFDVKSYRVIKYSTHFTRIEQLKSELEEVARQHRLGQVTFGNPVSDFASTAVAVEVVSPNGGLDSKTPDEIAGESLGWMDHLEKMLDSQDDVSETLTVLTQLMVDSSVAIKEQTAEIVARGQISDKTGFKQLRNNEAMVTRLTLQLADDMRPVEGDLSRSWNDFWNAAEGLIATIPPDQNPTEIEKMRSSMVEFRATLRELRAAMRELRSNLEAGHGISGRLKLAMTRLQKVVDDIMATLTEAEAFTWRLDEAIEVKWKIVETGHDDAPPSVSPTATL